MDIVIEEWTVNPVSGAVSARYSYALTDPLSGEVIPRGRYATLSRIEGPLAKPNAGDDDLRAALAAQLGLTVANVRVAAHVPPLPAPPL